MSTGSLFRKMPQEVDEAESQINENSRRIDYFVTEYTIEILAQKIHNGEYEIPAYQREYTWEEARK
ncbi:MAG TPA: hypothetical protein VK171_11710, partial [Fimbriimonas sp.]|nr:hypothetical protein [Fimbriimonas sp.]